MSYSFLKVTREYHYSPNNINCESANYPQPSGELAYSIWLFNQLMENNAVCLDPYNPNEITYYKDWENPIEFFAKESILELPHAPTMIPLKNDLAEIKEEERILFSILEFNDTCLATHPDYQNTQRKYWVYLPPHYNSSRTYPLMLFLDGSDYLGLFLTPAILDTLITQDDIPPCLAVFFDYSFDKRMVEYNCHDAFTDFISREFFQILSLKHGFSINHSPELTTIVGYSASGLAAFYAGIAHPERFGQVIAQSPSLEILQKPQLLQFIHNASSRHTRFYFETGSLEILPAELIFSDGSSQAYNSLQACRDTADELQRQGWEIDLQEFVGGHNSICWRQSLPARIMATQKFPAENYHSIVQHNQRSYNQIADIWLKEREWYIEKESIDQAIKKIKPGGKILDVGCGSGKPIAEYLLSHNFDVYGVDISARQIHHALQIIPKEKLWIGDIRFLHISQTFDAIFCWFTLFHIHADQQAMVLKKFFELLNLKGILSLTMADTTSAPQGEFDMIDSQTILSTMFGETFYHSGHARTINLELIKMAGFRIISEYCDQPGNQVILAQKTDIP